VLSFIGLDKNIPLLDAVHASCEKMFECKKNIISCDRVAGMSLLYRVVQKVRHCGNFVIIVVTYARKQQGKYIHIRACERNVIRERRNIRSHAVHTINKLNIGIQHEKLQKDQRNYYNSTVIAPCLYFYIRVGFMTHQLFK